MEHPKAAAWGRSVEEARQHILDAVRPLAGVPRGIGQVLGDVLAEDVVAAEDSPRFANSAMDGYAVRFAEVEAATGSPVTLPVAFEVPAGPASERPLPPAAAALIMTGGGLPDGADTVVMREDTEERGATVVILKAPSRLGANVRQAGSYFARGKPVLEAGRLLDAGAVGLLASLGRSTVVVRRRPRVAIVATGNELVDIDQAPGPGQIRNSSAYMTAALARAAGAEPVVMGIARDRVEHLRARFEEAIAAGDLILSIGGVSVGDYDLVRQVLDELGAEMGFWKVRIKPGKPLAFGIVAGRPLIGLPGNPVSSWVAFQQFVRPAIRRMRGFQESGQLPRVRARLARDVKSPAARTDYQRGQLVEGDDGLVFHPYPDQSSGNLMSIVGPTGLAVIPEGVGRLAAGSWVDVERVPCEGDL